MPVGYLSNHIIRLVGVDLNTEELVTKAFLPMAGQIS